MKFFWNRQRATNPEQSAFAGLLGSGLPASYPTIRASQPANALSVVGA
ncbi:MULTISPECIES: hypothetical protein [Olivibacter]|uniref:Uncharacterized protein n=1 Tax=Olivibacter jilunii TaxID=985016 RepID=A0ABW6B7Y6_9SPHI